MIGFGFDIPQGHLGYQMKAEVHVIAEVKPSLLTPVLKPPPVVIRRVKKGAVTVYFDFDSSELKEGEKKKLISVTGSVSVKGYASPEGSEEYNLILSEKRARAVADFLEKRGVKIKAIRFYGEKGCNLPPSLWSKCRKVEVY